MVQTPFRSPSRPSREFVIAVWLLSLVGLGLRAIPAALGGLWRDEAQSAAVATLLPFARIAPFLASHESHPPLYYYLLKPWALVAGHSDVALAALSVVLGTAAIPVAAVFCRRISGDVSGTFAALLVTFCGPLVRYSGQVRPYALLPLLAVAALGSSVSAVSSGGNQRHTVSLAILCAAMAWTHSVGMVYAAVLLLATACALASHSAGTARRHAARRVAASGLLTTALVSPWLPTLLYQAKHAGHGPPASPTRAEALFSSLGAPGANPIVLSLVLTLGAVATLVAGTLWMRRSSVSLETRDRLAALFLVLATPFVAGLVLNALSPWTDVTQQRVVLPVRIWFLVGGAAWTGSAAMARSTARRIGAAVFAVGAILLAAPWTLVSVLRTARTNVPQLVRRVAPQIQPDDLVLVVPQTLSPSVYRYLPSGAGRPIGYPEPDARRYVSYTDVSARHRDPAAFRALKESLRRARNARRRVWVFALAEIPDRGWTETDEALPPMRSVWDTTTIRAAQILRYLTIEYGGARRTEAPPRDSDQDEVAEVWLFTPPPLPKEGTTTQ